MTGGAAWRAEAGWCSHDGESVALFIWDADSSTSLKECWLSECHGLSIMLSSRSAEMNITHNRIENRVSLIQLNWCWEVRRIWPWKHEFGKVPWMLWTAKDWHLKTQEKVFWYGRKRQMDFLKRKRSLRWSANWASRKTWVIQKLDMVLHICNLSTREGETLIPGVFQPHNLI